MEETREYLESTPNSRWSLEDYDTWLRKKDKTVSDRTKLSIWVKALKDIFDADNTSEADKIAACTLRGLHHFTKLNARNTSQSPSKRCRQDNERLQSPPPSKRSRPVSETSEGSRPQNAPALSFTYNGDVNNMAVTHINNNTVNNNVPEPSLHPLPSERPSPDSEPSHGDVPSPSPNSKQSEDVKRPLFYERFDQLHSKNRWMLKKGFSVEVILATHARSPQASVELQNFILYIRGTELRELFKTNAQEIVDKFPDLAPPSDELCTAMEPYLKCRSYSDFSLLFKEKFSPDASPSHFESFSAWIYELYRTKVIYYSLTTNAESYCRKIVDIVYDLFRQFDFLCIADSSQDCGFDNNSMDGRVITTVYQLGKETKEAKISVVVSGSQDISERLHLMLGGMLRDLQGDADTSALEDLKTFGVVIAESSVQVVHCWGQHAGGVVLIDHSPWYPFPASRNDFECLEDIVKLFWGVVRIFQNAKNFISERCVVERKARFMGNVMSNM